MINFINNTMDRHIITIEDPIEYYHKHAQERELVLIERLPTGVGGAELPRSVSTQRAWPSRSSAMLVSAMSSSSTGP